MDYETRLVRARTLILQREKIDAELQQLFNLSEAPRRGRPPKQREPEPEPQTYDVAAE